MSKSIGGATLWARQTIDSDIFLWKPAEWFKIWFYIVSKVNHADSKQFKRGQGFFKYEWIQDHCHVSYAQVDHCLRWLREVGQVSGQKARRGIFITVLQYDLYQTVETYKSDTESEIKAIQKRDSINKNDKNKIQGETILETFNQVRGTKYKVVPSTNLSYWLSRYSLEEILTAIKNIPHDDFWSDKMTPEILFRKRNQRGEEVDYIGKLMNVKRKTDLPKGYKFATTTHAESQPSINQN